MFQPTTHVWGLLLLLMVHAADAQPQAMRGRSITLSAHPGAPPPEVWVALGRRTLIVFDARIDKGSVQLDPARFTLVDVGERSVLIEPVAGSVDPERAVLRVRYAEGGLPEWATLFLVLRSGEADGQVELLRPPLTLESCQAELARVQALGEESRAAVWMLSDRLRGGSVQSIKLILDLAEGWVYRFEDGLLFVLQVNKGAAPKPWPPTGAVLRSNADQKQKQEMRARSVHVREEPIVAGEWSPVAVEVAMPPPTLGKRFTLELRGAGGRRLELGEVQFPLLPGEKETRGE